MCLDSLSICRVPSFSTGCEGWPTASLSLQGTDDRGGWPFNSARPPRIPDSEVSVPHRRYQDPAFRPGGLTSRCHRASVAEFVFAVTFLAGGSDMHCERRDQVSHRQFAENDLAGRVHEALIKETLRQGIVGHVSRDSTAIPVREKPTPKGESDQKPMKRKRGRLRKGEVRPPKAKTRLEHQAAGDMTLGQMLDDLPKACDIGAKVDAQGNKNSWVGYKLPIDSADGGIPISCVLSSASLHDSQAAIPLADMSAQRVTYLYECMDSAYDAALVHDQENMTVSALSTRTREAKRA